MVHAFMFLNSFYQNKNLTYFSLENKRLFKLDPKAHLKALYKTQNKTISLILKLKSTLYKTSFSF